MWSMVAELHSETCIYPLISLSPRGDSTYSKFKNDNSHFRKQTVSLLVYKIMRVFNFFLRGRGFNFFLRKSQELLVFTRIGYIITVYKCLPIHSPNKTLPCRFSNARNIRGIRVRRARRSRLYAYFVRTAIK